LDLFLVILFYMIYSQRLMCYFGCFYVSICCSTMRIINLSGGGT